MVAEPSMANIQNLPRTAEKARATKLIVQTITIYNQSLFAVHFGAWSRTFEKR